MVYVVLPVLLPLVPVVTMMDLAVFLQQEMIVILPTQEIGQETVSVP